ncbi:MAG: hypothetical protein CMM62_04760 [Rhodospirillaceae bacterium]|nr:hypothetical protein [Rhodospirillaceae bacterium]MAX63489.1 hypothetical protein [Rhodospirillaceae bacterium]MBB56440.1 hypothetical protein [Rhodospirillaceae bacterium]|tara:strand:+ start:535 stop:2325 length:1791 start_codon:yes stop_codon:yes gene_type:complete
MTDILINDLRPRIQYVQADGELGTSVFDYPFPILSDGDLRVAVDDVILESSAYTITGTGQEQGGTIVFGNAPSAGSRISIWRDMPFQRTTDFSPGADLRAAVLNDELDRTALLLQQAEALVGDSIHRLPYDVDTALTLPLAPDRAGMFLSFDTEGRPVTKVPDSIGVTAQFALIYLGAYASAQAPTVRLNGTPLQQGDLFFNTDAQAMQVYSQTGWASAYIAEEDFLAVDGTSAMAGPLDLAGNTILNPDTVDGRDIAADGMALDLVISSSLPDIHDQMTVIRDTQYRLLWAAAVEHGIKSYQLINTYIDDFTDQSGIEDGDLAGSGYSYSASAAAYHCRTVGTNAAYAVAASSPIGNYSGSPGTTVDGSTGNYWQGGYTSVNAGDYVQYDLGAVMPVTKFRVYVWASQTMFANVRIVGSRTGAFSGEEAILGTGTFVNAEGWQDIDLVGTARYVRLVSADGSRTGNFNTYVPLISEIQILDAVISDMVLVSAPILAETTPLEARALVELELTGEPEVNTDIVLSISRDDGTTWTAVDLVVLENQSDTGRVLLAGTVDLSTQPIGTTLRLNLEAQNGADIILHCWGIQCDQALSLS